jgi:hypothetical protein
MWRNRAGGEHMPLLTELYPFPGRRRYKQATPTEFGKLSTVENVSCAPTLCSLKVLPPPLILPTMETGLWQTAYAALGTPPGHFVFCHFVLASQRSDKLPPTSEFLNLSEPP